MCGIKFLWHGTSSGLHGGSRLGRMATRKRAEGYNQFEGWVLIRFMFGGLFLVQFRWLDLCCPSVSSLEATLDGEDVLSFQNLCRGLQSGLGWFIPIILSHMCSCNLPLSKVTLAYGSPHQLLHLRGYNTVQGSLRSWNRITVFCILILLFGLVLCGNAMNLYMSK